MSGPIKTRAARIDLLLGEEVGLALDHHDGRLRPRHKQVQPRLAAPPAQPRHPAPAPLP